MVLGTIGKIGTPARHHYDSPISYPEDRIRSDRPPIEKKRLPYFCQTLFLVIDCQNGMQLSHITIDTNFKIRD
jgi:hypothetical protein